MKCAVIDIGSNSMRLTVYDAEKQTFKILFKERIMAGLAGYVEGGRLSIEGISCACDGLLEFRGMLEILGIDNVSVFATASLRNVSNTDEAVSEICAVTGFAIEVITGQEEATLGYTGAMLELDVRDGIFLDIGGASTELSLFSGGRIKSAHSFPIGSLKLYKDCVKKILPGKNSQKRIQDRIEEALSEADLFGFQDQSRLVCVGGTSRAALKLAQKVYGLAESDKSILRWQLDSLCGMLCRSDKVSADLILKTEPERIHTLIPGLMILRHMAQLFDVNDILISKYGVREGYLCQRIQTGI